MKRAKRSPPAYAMLAEWWARAGDSVRCQECILAALQHDLPDGILNTIERLARSPQPLALLRQALRDTAAATADPHHQVHLAEALVAARDVPAARTLLNNAARQATQTGNRLAITLAINLDLEHRLLDRKTAGAIMDFLDLHPTAAGPSRGWEY